MLRNRRVREQEKEQIGTNAKGILVRSRATDVMDPKGGARPTLPAS